MKSRLIQLARTDESSKHSCIWINKDLNDVALQDVFLMIRRKKTTIFTDAKESTTVLEVKKIIEGILKQKTEDQRLFKDDQVSQTFTITTIHDCSPRRL